MPRFQPRSRGRSKREAAYALLLATSVLTLTAPAAVKAQELGLRGEISESSIQHDQLSNAGKPRTASAQSKSTPGRNDSPAPAYVPVSPGAVPDAADSAVTTGGIAASTPDNSAFSDDPPPWRKARRGSPARTTRRTQAPR